MPATSARARITTAAEVPMDALLGFARRMYGPGAHQASAATYRWMYDLDPYCDGGLERCVVAVADGGEVVGLVNRLHMPWTVHGALRTVPAIGDLAVDPLHRKGGLGLRMAMACTRGFELAYVNGSNPNSSPLFRGLGYQELEGAFWGMRVQHRLRAAWRHARFRSLGRGPAAPQAASGPFGPFAGTERPDDELLGGLAHLLNADPAPVRPHWTVEGLRWRFFHPAGPRHMLLYRMADAKPSGAMVLSVGMRHGLRIARTMTWGSTAPDGFAALMQAAILAVRAMGIDVLAGFTLRDHEARAMRAAGLRPSTSAPATFLFHRARTVSMAPNEVSVQGASSDLGLEAMARGGGASGA